MSRATTAVKHYLTWRLCTWGLWTLLGNLLWPNVLAIKCPGMNVLETGGLSCSQIGDIISSHNELRQSVAQGLVSGQPSASNMMEMFWDEELANEAQKWANQCIFAHSAEKDRKIPRFEKVGQNIGISKSWARRPSNKIEFRVHIENWFKEHLSYKFGPMHPDDLRTSGHYSQLVWAKTYLVGCGYSRYRDSRLTYRLYVCNYGPSGNDFDVQPYEIGDLSCPNDQEVSEKYKNLCRMKNPPQFACKGENEDKNALKNIGSIENRFFMEPVKNSTQIKKKKDDIKIPERKLKFAHNIHIEKIYNPIIYNFWNT